MGTPGGFLTLVVFVVVSGLVAALVFYWNRHQILVWARLRQLAAPSEKTAGPSLLGRLSVTLLPSLATTPAAGEGSRHANLAARLKSAGFYDPKALPTFLGVKILLVGAAALALLGLNFVGGLTSTQKLALGAAVIGLSFVGPGLWLDGRKRARQRALRRGLPDALDMLVLCLEGGVSLHGAMQRVTTEIQSAHPELGRELNIAQREILLGQSPGEAVQNLARRVDLEEAQGLAAILLQSERYGVSVGKALRIHADTLRQQRRQRAEEQAQKAAVKILFPTLLCIFPAIFIVVLGPAALQIMQTLARMK